MNDSNMRFDPYTGDPIPDDTPMNSNNTNPVHSNPDVASVQDMNYSNTNNSNEAPTENNAASPESNTGSYTTPPSQPNNTVYQTTSGDSSNPYTSYQDTQSQQQYNPYTGQPMNGNYNQGENNEEKDRKANIFGVVSLITGIAAILFSFCSACCCPFISLIAGIVGIIFGCLAKNSMGVRKGTAIAGIITSSIGLALMIILTIVQFAYMGSDDFWDSFQREFRKSMNGYDNNYDDYDDDYDDDVFHYDFNSYKNFDNNIYDSDNFY